MGQHLRQATPHFAIADDTKTETKLDRNLSERKLLEMLTKRIAATCFSILSPEMSCNRTIRYRRT